jgi:DNA-binding Lrp family transcriptional regulator
MGERRNQHGRFTPEHTDTDILAAVRAHEPAATSEVADEVGMTRQGADRRLRRLRDTGRVNSKKIGASLVWFVRDHAHADADDSSAEDVQDAGVTPDTGTEAVTPDRTREAESADVKPESDVVNDILGSWNPDGNINVYDARDEAADAVAWLRGVDDDVREGRRTKSDFVDALAAESDRSERVWWERAVQPALRELAAHGLVEYRPGHHDYRWIGSDADAGTEGDP